MTFILVSKVDDVLKPDVIKWSAFYEHRIKLGSVSYDRFAMGLKVEVLIYPIQKVIFHLEAFVAKFMRIYERSVHSKSSITHTSTNINVAGLWAWTSSNLQIELRRMMIAH